MGKAPRSGVAGSIRGSPSPSLQRNLPRDNLEGRIAVIRLRIRWPAAVGSSLLVLPRLGPLPPSAVPPVLDHLHLIDARERLSQMMQEVELLSRHDDQVSSPLSLWGFWELEDFIERHP